MMEFVTKSNTLILNCYLVQQSPFELLPSSLLPNPAPYIVTQSRFPFENLKALLYLLKPYRCESTRTRQSGH